MRDSTRIRTLRDPDPQMKLLTIETSQSTFLKRVGETANQFLRFSRHFPLQSHIDPIDTLSRRGYSRVLCSCSQNRLVSGLRLRG